MAKTKVFELAKELGIHSKDVITFLQGKGVEAKAAQSSIEDDATAMVKKHFGKSEGEKRRKRKQRIRRMKITESRSRSRLRQRSLLRRHSLPLSTVKAAQPMRR